MSSRYSEIILPGVSAIASVLAFCPAVHAVTYLTVEEAQTEIFPSEVLSPLVLSFSDAERLAIEEQTGTEMMNHSPQAWVTPSGDIFFLDRVLGKHEFISYAVGINRDGTVRRVEVLEYLESYGEEVREQEWLSQFAGKSAASVLQLNDDIKNISGATISSRHITEGVKRLLVAFNIVSQRTKGQQ